MAYVPAYPKDLFQNPRQKAKPSIRPKRQLVYFPRDSGGPPGYLFSRGSIGNSAAMFLMIGLMPRSSFLAMYERDGLPLKKVLKKHHPHPVPLSPGAAFTNLKTSMRCWRQKRGAADCKTTEGPESPQAESLKSRALPACSEKEHLPPPSRPSLANVRDGCAG